MPGLDKRLARAPQLYSRIGFAHQMEPLSEEETRFFLDQRWSHRVSAHSDDFTDREAVTTILRITRGNIRLIDRLMRQVEHVLVQPQTVVDNSSPFLLLAWLPFSLWFILLNTYPTLPISSSEDLYDFSFPLAPALILLPPLPGMALAP
jgi:hypothetical protein